VLEPKELVKTVANDVVAADEVAEAEVDKRQEVAGAEVAGRRGAVEAVGAALE